jgi:hypothetical protein
MQVWNPPPATAKAVGFSGDTDGAAAAEEIGREAAIAPADASRRRASAAVKVRRQWMRACGDLICQPSLVA